MDVVLQPVFGLRNGIGVERVGFDDVRAGFEILAMDILDDLRMSDIQDVVIEPQFFGMGGEFLAPVVGLAEIVTLDHRADGAVQNHNATIQDFLELSEAILVAHRMLLCG